MTLARRGRLVGAAGVLPMLLASPVRARAQAPTPPRDTTASAPVSPGSGKWPLVLPGITYAPETRWAAVLGIFKVTKASGDSAQRPNNYAFRGLYSQKHQLQTSLSLGRWSAGNADRLEMQAAYSQYPNSFFGVRAALGDTAEQYTPRSATFTGSYLHRVSPGLYFGGRLDLESTRVTSVAPGGRLQALLSLPAYAGGDRWRTATATFIASWDTRDVFFYPTRGSAVWLNVGRALGVPGTTNQFTRVSLDARHYVPLGAGSTLAVQGYGVGTSGRIPFDNLPTLGGNSLLRGYFDGRFRDRAAMALQAEYRSPMWRRVSAVAFTGAGTVAPHVRDFRADEVRLAYGLGLRLKLNDDHLNVRLDWGFGRRSRGLYVTAGEAF